MSYVKGPQVKLSRFCPMPAFSPNTGPSLHYYFGNVESY